MTFRGSGAPRRLLRAIFPTVLLLLVTSQLMALPRYHRGEAPGQAYYLLRLREPGLRPLRPRFAGFLQLRPAVAGRRILVPPGVELDEWSWRNLALADLEPLARPLPARPHRLRGDSTAVVLLPERNVFLVESPEARRRGPLVLLSAEGNLFLAPASRLGFRSRRP